MIGISPPGSNSNIGEGEEEVIIQGGEFQVSASTECFLSIVAPSSRLCVYFLRHIKILLLILSTDCSYLF